jgi:acyl-CoA dehydrogenase
MTDNDNISEIRRSVQALCAEFPGAYWREKDSARAYPEEFVDALTKAGFLAALIPESYGGSGLKLDAAAVIMEEIQASGCNGASAHAQMYIMNTLLKYGSDTQKREYLPRIATGEMRLQAFGVSEPTSGTDTLSLRTVAVRDGDEYVINGQKIWTSRAEYSDLMMLLARTTPREDVASKTEGLSIFLVDMRKVVGPKSEAGGGMTIKPIRTMMNHSTTEVFFDDMCIPASALIGQEGKGFRYILSGMNAERILIAAECIGDAKWFIKKATDYASERNVFGNPGAEANMAKLLASEASWAAADMCVQTHGGFGFAEEYDVERKFREARLYTVAPISTNLILSYLAEHVLGLPRSY